MITSADSSGRGSGGVEVSLPPSGDRVMDFCDVVNLRIRSAPEQIASAVYAAILDGSLEPGRRLPSEEELAEVFEVSRPTIRAALRRLKSHGVISSARGRTGGMVVQGVGPRTLTRDSRAHIDLALGGKPVTNEQLREVRYELELLSASSAAKKHSHEDLLAFADNELRRPGRDGVPMTRETALQYDLSFHRILARSSGNPIISSFVSAAIITYRSFDTGDEPRSPQQIVAHLEDVLAAVKARNPDAARQAMERHLLETGGPCRHCLLSCEVGRATGFCAI